MMHTIDARVKGLCNDHIVKMVPVVYSGAMEKAPNQGHVQHKLGSGGTFSKRDNVQKIGLSLSHWVPEILGPKVGLLFHRNVLFNSF